MGSISRMYDECGIGYVEDIDIEYLNRDYKLNAIRITEDIKKITDFILSVMGIRKELFNLNTCEETSANWVSLRGGNTTSGYHTQSPYCNAITTAEALYSTYTK